MGSRSDTLLADHFPYSFSDNAGVDVNLNSPKPRTRWGIAFEFFPNIYKCPISKGKFYSFELHKIPLCIEPAAKKLMSLNIAKTFNIFPTMFRFLNLKLLTIENYRLPTIHKKCFKQIKDQSHSNVNDSNEGANFYALDHTKTPPETKICRSTHCRLLPNPPSKPLWMKKFENLQIPITLGYLY